LLVFREAAGNPHHFDCYLASFELEFFKASPGGTFGGTMPSVNSKLNRDPAVMEIYNQEAQDKLDSLDNISG